MSENHLEIILGNLIRNAIDNTDSGEVKVSLFENGFSVKDTGFGIEAEEIDLIVKLNYHGSNSQGPSVARATSQACKTIRARICPLIASISVKNS